MTCIHSDIKETQYTKGGTSKLLDIGQSTISNPISNN